MFDAYLLPREQRIAHLEIHGWTAVKDSAKDLRAYFGIWNDQLQIGFAQSRSISGLRVIRLGDDGHPPPQLCEWSELSDAVLDAIDARLAET